jgi:hypothetical protein
MKRVMIDTFRPVLSTESAEHFESLRAEFRNDIKPRDAIERMYCDDIAILFWEIKRWRRLRDATLQLAFRNALYEVVVEKLADMEEGQETVSYLDQWFSHKPVRQDISETLEKYHLDESAIEAEAFRQCSPFLSQFEQLLASAEARRDRALLGIALRRRSLAEELRSKAIDVVEGKVLRLEQQKEASRG